MNANSLLMLYRLNLATLCEDLDRFNDGELVDIQSDLIEVLRLCSDKISGTTNQRLVLAKQPAATDQ